METGAPEMIRAERHNGHKCGGSAYSARRRLLHYVVKARNGMGAYPGSSFNLDFHMIRHYGDMDSSMLEKDYVPRRSQSVPSVVTAFAQQGDGLCECGPAEA